MDLPSKFHEIVLFTDKSYEMHNVHQLVNIYLLLREVLASNVPGEIVELGCYNGTSAIVIQKSIEELNSNKELHLYDSFEGLPEKSTMDEPTEYVGGLCKTSKKELKSNFELFQEPLPYIHEGWFEDILVDELPRSICFAHLDGDMYDSIMCSLKHTYPRLHPGAIVVVDDYCDPDLLKSDNTQVKNEILPGVRRAVSEFLESKPETIRGLPAGPHHHGFFKKK